MNELNQRQTVLALVIAAGLAGCAADRTARACPPEDGSTEPAQQILERNVVVTRPQVYGLTMPMATRLGGDRPGSTLETRVYRPGEAMKRYNMRVVGEGTPGQTLNGVTIFSDEMGGGGDGPQRVLRVKENGRDVRVEERDGKVTATINGKEVPSKSVKVKDGKIEVRDADGNTVLNEEWPEIDVLRGTFAPAVPPVPPVSPVPPVPPGITWTIPAEEMPKVMMGITMDDADESLIEQLGLPEGDYAMIQTVPDGLPACKAGLQPKDIIVSVDGQSAAGSEAIRDVLRTKEPGDKVSLEVVRKGSRVKADVQLEAFDGKRFRAYGPAMSGQNDQVWKQYEEQMQKLNQKFGSKINENNRALSGEIQKRMELDRARIAIPRGKNSEPFILMSPEEATSKLEERLNAMEDQLKRLEELLKRLESRSASPRPTGGGGGDSPAPYFAAGM